jgi:hypothetical protein
VTVEPETGRVFALWVLDGSSDRLHQVRFQD